MLSFSFSVLNTTLSTLIMLGEDGLDLLRALQTLPHSSLVSSSFILWATPSTALPLLLPSTKTVFNAARVRSSNLSGVWFLQRHDYIITVLWYFFQCLGYDVFTLLSIGLWNGDGLFERNACTTFLKTMPYLQNPMLYRYCRSAVEYTICSSRARVCAALQWYAIVGQYFHALKLYKRAVFEVNPIVDIKGIVLDK